MFFLFLELLFVLGKFKVIFIGFFFLGCGIFEDEEVVDMGVGLGGGVIGVLDFEFELELEL